MNRLGEQKKLFYSNLVVKFSVFRKKYQCMHFNSMEKKQQMILIYVSNRNDEGAMRRASSDSVAMEILNLVCLPSDRQPEPSI